MTVLDRSRTLRLAVAALTAVSLAGCGAADRLADVGKAPKLSAIEDLPGSPGSDRRYALRFTSKSSAADGTFSLSRAGFAATSVHLVAGPSGTSLTAVVNRL